jgi:hypothetical protein
LGDQLIPTLHLGVIDVPYATRVAEPQRRVGVRQRKGGPAEAFSAAPSGAETTGDVATILEDKYHIMEVFYNDVGGESIGKALEISTERAIKNLLLGQPAASIVSLTLAAEGEIEEAFKLFLSQQEMDHVVGGVPTQAALNGVNHRLKHPYAKSNSERPSFIDTGTYQASFKAWVV